MDFYKIFFENLKSNVYSRSRTPLFILNFTKTGHQNPDNHLLQVKGQKVVKLKVI